MRRIQRAKFDKITMTENIWYIAAIWMGLAFIASLISIRVGISVALIEIVVGVIVSYAINFALRNTGANNWRWMFLTGVAPSLMFFLFIVLAPETPRFLAITGKLQEAFALLERIGGTESAHAQISDIAATMHKEPQTWRGLQRPGVPPSSLGLQNFCSPLSLSG